MQLDLRVCLRVYLQVSCSFATTPAIKPLALPRQRPSRNKPIRAYKMLACRSHLWWRAHLRPTSRSPSQPGRKPAQPQEPRRGGTDCARTAGAIKNRRIVRQEHRAGSTSPEECTFTHVQSLHGYSQFLLCAHSTLQRSDCPSPR